MEEPPPPPPPPPHIHLSLLENCIISSSQEDLLDQKGFAFSDNSNIHQDGQVDEEFEQPSLPLDDHNTGIRICSLEEDDSSISSSGDHEDLAGEAEKYLGLLQCHDDDSAGEEENPNSGKHCGSEGGEKRIRLVGECSSGGDKKEERGDKKEERGDKKEECGDKKEELEEEEEDTLMNIAIKAGLEMPRPRWWRSGGYETR